MCLLTVTSKFYTQNVLTHCDVKVLHTKNVFTHCDIKVLHKKNVFTPCDIKVLHKNKFVSKNIPPNCLSNCKMWNKSNLLVGV